MEAIELYKEESAKLAQHEAECKAAGKQVGGLTYVYVCCEAFKRSTVVECQTLKSRGPLFESSLVLCDTLQTA